MEQLRDIDASTLEGQALLSAISILTATEGRTNSHPDDVVKEVGDHAKKMYGHRKPTGIGLIAIERREQINKHGYTIESDYQANDDFQLLHAAKSLIDGGIDHLHHVPYGWEEDLWKRMMMKPLKQRIVMAAALLAAQVDIILEEEQDFADSLKP